MMGTSSSFPSSSSSSTSSTTSTTSSSSSASSGSSSSSSSSSASSSSSSSSSTPSKLDTCSLYTLSKAEMKAIKENEKHIRTKIDQIDDILARDLAKRKMTAEGFAKKKKERAEEEKIRAQQKIGLCVGDEKEPPSALQSSVHLHISDYCDEMNEFHAKLNGGIWVVLKKVGRSQDKSSSTFSLSFLYSSGPMSSSSSSPIQEKEVTEADFVSEETKTLALPTKWVRYHLPCSSLSSSSSTSLSSENECLDWIVWFRVSDVSMKSVSPFGRLVADIAIAKKKKL
eukprot:TRINITY_DN137_c1_g1_i2.p1 TRINITY_DN137_c1_g1~~TRINITY_DN137_c1_g1_i2.p1  ORF type:complete len:284 (+),score=162.89 TRINITY_DN137_c1_g1_i2:60-911(+)